MFEHLGSRILPDSVLVTDRHKAYLAIARQLGIQHVQLNASHERRRGIYHLQHVNAWHRRFKDWLRRFNGVSTHYLDNYIAWHLFLESAHHPDPAEDARELLKLALTAA